MIFTNSATIYNYLVTTKTEKELGDKNPPLSQDFNGKMAKKLHPLWGSNPQPCIPHLTRPAILRACVLPALTHPGKMAIKYENFIEVTLVHGQESNPGLQGLFPSIQQCPVAMITALRCKRPLRSFLCY